VTLFHRSLDRAILLVTLLRRLRLRKIDFGTFQLGIAQLVPRVSGSPLPPPRPPKLAKKKKFRKKFRTRPPPLPLLIGNRRERSEKISRSDKKDRWSSGGPRNLSVNGLELSPGRRSSRSLKRALVRLLQPNPHRAPKVNQSNQTSLHRYLPWPIISTFTS
jgi:hypothetical protein